MPSLDYNSIHAQHEEMKAPESEPELINETENILTDLVKYVVRNPESVKITSKAVASLVAFVIKVDQADVSRVVGSKGKHFKALQTIAVEVLRTINREAHVAIDEKAQPFDSRFSAPKTFMLGTAPVRRQKSIQTLLKRVLELFLPAEAGLELKPLDVENLLVIEVKVKKQFHHLIYGRNAEFEYGIDGHIIGSIKNIFDGVGKNTGKLVKITVTQV